MFGKPMKFSVKECSDKAGVSVKTIHNYIKSGKLSAEKNATGKIVIDSSELYRLFPDMKENESHVKSKTEVQTELHLDKNLSFEFQIDNCKQQIENYKNRESLLQDQITLLKEQLEDYKSRESKLLEMASSATKLLTHTPKTKKRWFGR
jgi:predicted site-specific integrase-resolvase